MHQRFFSEFLATEHTLRVYEGERLIFASSKDGLLPLLEYIDQFTPHPQAVIYDKVMGNAAALLSIKAGCREVYSPLGSQLAVNTLDKYGIRHYLTEIIPCIQKPGGKDMCPMEKLSLGKEPDEFYHLVRKATGPPPADA